MAKNSEHTDKISDIGEFGLIKHITSDLETRHSSTIKSVGDDAAVLNFNNKHIVVTTDLLVEGIHFDLIYTPLKHLGYKSVIVNLSDVYAMNATPKQITVSLAVSNKISLKIIEELYEGIKLACDLYNIDLIGGDTSSSVTGMLISVTAIGEADADKIVYRNTAKHNDLVCVSGNLGGAYAGLQLLEREKAVFGSAPGIQPDLGKYSYILEKQLKPEARKDIIDLFKRINIKPTSMIDISDGISSDISHICTASGVGCKLFEDKIPIHDQTISFAEEINLNPSILALNGGEDYELLFTVSLDEYEKIKDSQGIHVIGHISKISSGRKIITREGTETDLYAQGWNTFKGEEK
ncbi:thiamine-phosphate kinase [Bacteroidota bacterium]